MATTIPGGAYQNPDGSWHDANGDPLSSGQIQRARELKAGKPAQKPVTPPPPVTTVTAPVLPPAAPAAPEVESPPKPTRRSRG